MVSSNCISPTFKTTRIPVVGTMDLLGNSASIVTGTKITSMLSDVTTF